MLVWMYLLIISLLEQPRQVEFADQSFSLYGVAKPCITLAAASVAHHRQEYKWTTSCREFKDFIEPTGRI
jgi:hypothetical protein